MHKKAKNYAHLTDDKKEIINEIITICVAKIYHFVMTHNNSKKYANEILKSLRLKKEFCPYSLYISCNKHVT